MRWLCSAMALQELWRLSGYPRHAAVKEWQFAGSVPVSGRRIGEGARLKVKGKVKGKV